MKADGAAVSVNSNVSIKVFNSKNELVQSIDKHNKATVVMVEGLLHFLQGWYSTTEFNRDSGGGTSEDSYYYIPVQVGFGDIGVNTQTEAEYGNKKMFLSVNSGDFVQPTFSSTRLQKPLLKWEADAFVDYSNFSDSEITAYEDLNNSESLRLLVKIPPGKLVGENAYTGDPEGESPTVEFTPYLGSFYNPETGYWTAMITEVGLFSSTGTLLARVLLDSPVVRKEVYDSTGLIGYTYEFTDPDSNMNPIVTDEDTTVVIEWRIGLVSVSDNDNFVTHNSIRSKALAEALSVAISEFIEGEGSGNPPSADWINTKILEILSAYDTVANNTEEVTLE